jgi:predicted component of type VI protein secretion system
VMLATAPPPADPVDTAYLDDLVAPASAVSPTPEPTAPRARTLPRAKRGIVWSARLGRVVAIEEDVVDDAAAVPGDPTR